MAEESSLADFLERAQEISILANDLGRAFQSELEQARANGEIDPSAWNRHKAEFEKLWKSLLSLASEIQNPPEGSGAVGERLAQAAENAREIRRLVGTPDYWQFADFFPNLNSVAWELHQAIKHVRKTSDSVDPFAFLDEPRSTKCESVPALSLLDRFPVTLAGHIGFIEWMRGEVHNAAEAKRQQLVRGYSDDTLASMVSGIKWAEAGNRVSSLSTLPTEVVEQVARVLRRDLTVGTVEEIDDLLTPNVRQLRNAWENLANPRSDKVGNDDFVKRLMAGPDDAELTLRELALLEAHLKQPATGKSETQGKRNKLILIRDFNRNLQAAQPTNGPTAPDAADEVNRGGDTTAELANPRQSVTKCKRSTGWGEGRAKLIAALTKHHQYADSGCLNQDPIGNNKLARLAEVSESTASTFFTQEFGRHGKYRALCRDMTRLVASLKLLNQEFSPHHLFGSTPPGERDDEE